MFTAYNFNMFKQILKLSQNFLQKLKNCILLLEHIYCIVYKYHLYCIYIIYIVFILYICIVYIYSIYTWKNNNESRVHLSFSYFFYFRTNSLEGVRVRRGRKGTSQQFFVSTTNGVTTHHYFFRRHIFSSEGCFCDFKCILLCLIFFVI